MGKVTVVTGCTGLTVGRSMSGHPKVKVVAGSYNNSC